MSEPLQFDPNSLTNSLFCDADSDGLTGISRVEIKRNGLFVPFDTLYFQTFKDSYAGSEALGKCQSILGQARAKGKSVLLYLDKPTLAEALVIRE